MKGPCSSRVHFIKRPPLESYMQLFSPCLFIRVQSSRRTSSSIRQCMRCVFEGSSRSQEGIQTFGVSVYEGRRSDPWVCSQIRFHQIRAHKHTQQEHRPHVCPCVGSVFVCIYITEARCGPGFTHFYMHASRKTEFCLLKELHAWFSSRGAIASKSFLFSLQYTDRGLAPM